MSEESPTLKSIKWTRTLFEKSLRDPLLLAYMAANDLEPDDIENVVIEILEYLDKTKEEKPDV